MNKLFFLIIIIIVNGCSNNFPEDEKGNDTKLSITEDKRSKYDFVIENSCGFDMKLINQKVYSFDSDLEADDALKRIMKLTGLPANFKIRAASVDNACAVIKCDENGNCDRYILYNQQFMERVKDQTATHYAELAILAHEIAHHLSGHTLGNTGNSYDMELESDKFAGFMLYKLGASIEDAKKAYSNLSDNGSATHPPKSARLAAVTNGWYDAKRNGEKIETLSNVNQIDKTLLIPENGTIASSIVNEKLELAIAELKRFAKWCDKNRVQVTDATLSKPSCFLYLDDLTRTKYGNGKKMPHYFEIWDASKNKDEFHFEMWPINEVAYVLRHTTDKKYAGEFWTFDYNNRILGCYGGRMGSGFRLL